MKRILFFTLVILMVTACTSSQQKKLESIQALEKKLFDSTVVQIDNAKGQELVNQYLEYAKNFPTDSNTTEFLYKASTVYANMGKLDESIKILNDMQSQYPENKIMVRVLHYQGFLFQEMLGDTSNARRVFTELIQKFPNTNEAKDAQACIDNIGFTTDELVNKFEENIRIQDSIKNLTK